MKFEKTVDPMGRVTIPAAIRMILKLGPGDPLTVWVEGDRIIITPAECRCTVCGKAVDNNTSVPVAVNPEVEVNVCYECIKTATSAARDKLMKEASLLTLS